MKCITEDCNVLLTYSGHTFWYTKTPDIDVT